MRKKLFPKRRGRQKRHDTDENRKRAAEAACGFGLVYCCPYCDFILGVRVDSLRMDGVTKVVCEQCASTYYVRRPTQYMVYPAEYVDIDDMTQQCKIVTRVADRLRAFQQARRKALQETKP